MLMKPAFRDTMKLAFLRGYQYISTAAPNADYNHLIEMFNKVIDENNDFSEAKLGRWLGYAQGVLVANRIITLEEAKEINKKYQNEN